jgi:ADP-dependent NAD(P)H-hydrate dehydratase / NAD(P)H-hydrate epimerase
MITSEEMLALEDSCQELGISKIQLMENAGRGFYLELMKHIRKTDKVLVVCGPGNNGGDGFVISLYLNANGYDVKAYFSGDFSKLKKEAQFNYMRLKETTCLTDSFATGYDIIVDALFGIGFKGIPRAPSDDMIKKINSSGARIFSVDVPSGMDADTGHGEHVHPEFVFTFHDIKPGLMKMNDKVKIIDIGIPEDF